MSNGENTVNFPHPMAKNAHEDQLLKEHKSRMMKFMQSHEYIFNVKIRKTIAEIYDKRISKDNIIKLVTHPMRVFIIALTDPDETPLMDLYTYTSYQRLPKGGSEDE